MIKYRSKGILQPVHEPGSHIKNKFCIYTYKKSQNYAKKSTNCSGCKTTQYKNCLYILIFGTNSRKYCNFASAFKHKTPHAVINIYSNYNKNKSHQQQKHIFFYAQSPEKRFIIITPGLTGGIGCIFCQQRNNSGIVRRILKLYTIYSGGIFTKVILPRLQIYKTIGAVYI